MIRLAVHFGLETKSSIRKQEIKVKVAKKLVQENIFETYDFAKQTFEPAKMAEFEFQFEFENRENKTRK